MLRQRKEMEQMVATRRKKPATKKLSSLSKRNKSKQNNYQSIIVKTLLGCLGVILLAWGGKYGFETLISPNPLVGKWRTQNALGIVEIEFTRTSMSMFGSQTPVSYDINGSNIIVFDNTINVGKTYKLLDANTISTESSGFKTLYKRVK